MKTSLSTFLKTLFAYLFLSISLQAQSLQTMLQQADAEPDSLKAIALYTKLVQRDPSVGAAYFGRAVMRRRAGQLPEAITDMDQAIRLEPKRADYYAQRAYLYLLINEYDRAARDAKQAVLLAPEKADFYSTLSYCQTKQGRYDEAEKTAQKGIDLNPASPFPYRNRGRARLYRGQTDAAITDFEAALQRNHREPFRVYSDLGEAYQQKKQFDQALTYCNKALAIRPDYVEALVLKGQLNVQLHLNPSLPASTFNKRRVALVIGNGTYQHASNLSGQPINDAQDMKVRLTELGFSVDVLTDASYATTRSRLIQFYKNAKEADIALLYFSGHGIEFQGTNYLLPIDTQLDLQHPDAMEDRLLSVSTLIDQIQAINPRYCILILDACRSNPFGKTPPAPAPSTGSGATTAMQANRSVTAASNPSSTQAGQAPIARGGITGSGGFKAIKVENKILNCLVALATSPGTVALNGPNRNGYYTEAILKALHRGRRLEDVLREVRGDVMQQTQKKNLLQQPEYLAKTTEDIIL